MKNKWPVDPFLDEIAVQNSIQAALQRSRTYATENGRERFRRLLTCQLRREAGRYVAPVTEDDHIVAIRRICCVLSKECGEDLADGKLRFGIAQKAFNLYLKFLWKYRAIPEPPHCPIDGIVLKEIDHPGPWTKFSSENYAEAIKILKKKADPISLAEWESDVWLKTIQQRPKP